MTSTEKKPVLSCTEPCTVPVIGPDIRPVTEPDIEPLTEFVIKPDFVAHKPTIAARGLLAIFWLYRMTLSYFLGGYCRFTPTCSRYATEAVTRYGALRGGHMTIKRLCRCHPWGGSGFDPVPEENPPLADLAKK